MKKKRNIDKLKKPNIERNLLPKKQFKCQCGHIFTDRRNHPSCPICFKACSVVHKKCSTCGKKKYIGVYAHSCKECKLIKRGIKLNVFYCEEHGNFEYRAKTLGYCPVCKKSTMKMRRFCEDCKQYYYAQKVYNRCVSCGVERAKDTRMDKLTPSGRLMSKGFTYPEYPQWIQSKEDEKLLNVLRTMWLVDIESVEDFRNVETYEELVEIRNKKDMEFCLENNFGDMDKYYSFAEMVLSERNYKKWARHFKR